MKLKLDITPDLVAMMAAEIRAGERAVSTATREAGNGLKSAWRAQITGAGLGQRLARTIRSEQFPKGKPSLNAASLVWSKAPVIVGAHDTGPLIRSKSGFWLTIPTPAAGRGLRGGKITPGEWERRTGLRLRFVYRRSGPSLLVAEGRLNARGRAVASRSKTGRGVTTVPIFLLVPQVWGERFPVRATAFAPEAPHAREAIAQSRTLKGTGAAGVATVGAAGVEVAQEVLAEAQGAVLPLVPHLDTLRWLFILLALGGVAVAVWARIDDWKKGLR